MSSIQELDQLCSACLSNIDYAEKTKVEDKLRAFVTNLEPNNFGSLLNSISQSSIFVIISLLINNFPQPEKIPIYLIRSIQTFSDWLGEDFSLRRNNQSLSYHVVGKCKQWIGQLAKSTYHNIISENSQKNQVFKYFSGLSQQLRLFTYLSLIEVMNIVDYKLDYLSLRSLMYNFQKDWIPLMFKQVNTTLKKFSETDQLQPIILKIQNSLNFNENHKSVQQFSQLEFKKIEITTKLLQNLTDFQYNIDINEYEKVVQYDDSPIQFPQPVQQIIAKGLYSKVQTVLKRLSLYFPQHPITQSVFKCFSKISSPLNNDNKLKIQGIQTSIFIASQKITSNMKFILLDFNLRLIKNITFSALFLAQQALTIKWIEMILELSDWVFKNTNVIYRNIHVDNIAKIFNTIFQGSSKKDLKQFRASFKKISQTLLVKLCSFLFQGNKSLVSQNVMDFNQMKNKNQQQFRSWVPTIFLSPKINFQTLRNAQISLYSNPTNLNNILNFNLLIGYLIVQYLDCFQQNIHYQPIGQQAIEIFGDIIKQSFQFLSLTNESLSVSYHGSVLYFLSSFLQAVIDSFEFDEQTQSSFVQKYVSQFKSIPLEKLIIQCVKQIGSRLSVPNPDLIKYSFKILQENTFSLQKHYQSSFTQSVLYKQLISFYVNLASTSFKAKQIVKCRKYLFNNLTTLVLYQNNYCITETINNLITLIQKTQYDNQMLKLSATIHDIRGIASQFKTQHHLGEFIQIITPALQKLNRIVFVKDGDLQLSKQTLKIYTVIFTNKITEGKTINYSFLLTKVYLIILPFWANIINQFNNLDEIMIQKNIQPVLEIVTGLTRLLKNNICDPHYLKDFSGLVAAILISFIKSFDVLEKVPNDMIRIIRLFQQLTKQELIESIFQLFQKDQLYMLFRVHILMYKVFVNQLKCFVNKQKQQSIKQMESVNLISQGGQNLYDFIKIRYLTIPSTFICLKKNKIQSNLGIFLSFEHGLMNQLILQLFRMILLTVNKLADRTTFSFCSKQIRNLIVAYPDSYKWVWNTLQKQASNKKMQQILKIIYSKCKSIRQLDEMGQDREGQLIQDQFLSDFEYLLHSWAQAFYQKKIVLDDY